MKIQLSKKHLTAALTALVCLGAAGMAEAGDRNHRDGYRANHGGGYGRHHAPVQRYRNRHYGRQYGRHYGRHGYGRHNYGHRYRHHSSRHHLRNGLKIAAGALVVGSIVHAINDNHRDRYRERRVVRRVVRPSNPDFRYQLDTDGQCYEVRYNTEGQEVWTWVDSSYCN